jgi:hypothetical protein
VERAVIAEEDRVRRKRVGEIFGEGCFKSAADYQASTLIFQLGDSPDHYYQSFIWSNRAFQLGDKNSLQCIALSVESYLVSIGHKQLLGTQAINIKGNKGCYCFQPSEPSVPEKMVLKFGGMSKQKRVELYSSLIK